ncbi:TldD protein [Klebsiella variicola]|uniref:TldD protein n=1 Tax=Klebsiella variicola TaxID=244366 RepID=A0A7H4M8H5_KLEVA|nr:TldD protein [Klebsiella variicola]
MAWIKDGVLHTDDTLVDGLEADIAMKGSVDLVRRRLDLQAVVAPEISATVGVAAAFAVNPIVGAAVLPPARCWARCGTKSRFCAIALLVRLTSRRSMRCCARRVATKSNDLTIAGNCRNLNRSPSVFPPVRRQQTSSITMSLNLVSEQLLSANGLNHQDLFAILGQLTERRLDYGDLYFQSSYHESWVLEDSIIKDGSYNIDQGVGVRAVSGEKTGFAYADQISKLALEQSAQAARTIVRDTGNGKVQDPGSR